MDVQAQMNLPPPPPPSNLESAMCWPKHDLSTSGIEKVLDPNIHVYKEPIPPCHHAFLTPASQPIPPAM